MKKTFCDCCGKETKLPITLPYLYWTEATIEGYHSTTVSLDLCCVCYPDVESGAKKPKPITEVIDIIWD